jgi:hypothetical protein
MAEVTLGEAFAGRKLDDLGGDPPSGAPVTYYLPKILTMICSASFRSPPATPRSRLLMAPTERPGIGNAMIFTSMAIVKVVAMQGCSG